MMLLVLHENPYEAAIRVPKQYKHEQLLELMHMISCIVDFGYKQLLTGKKIKEWIAKNIGWTYVYAKTLFQDKNLNLKEETKIKYKCLLDLLLLKGGTRIVPNAKTAIWRYSKEYSSEYPTNSELDIDLVCKLYKTYLCEFKWFGKKEVKKMKDKVVYLKGRTERSKGD